MSTTTKIWRNKRRKRKNPDSAARENANTEADETASDRVDPARRKIANIGSTVGEIVNGVIANVTQSGTGNAPASTGKLAFSLFLSIISNQTLNK